jgi:hypothetical protein
LLIAGLVGSPAHAQRLTADAGGTLAWSGDESVAPQNQPGLLRAGASGAGRTRGYLLFRPPNPAFDLGHGPARLYVYVLNFPAAGSGELALFAYTVAPRFGPRDATAEQGPDGGFLWQQIQNAPPLAVGPACPQGEITGAGDPQVGHLSWHVAPPPPTAPGAPAPGPQLAPDGHPVPGWHYLELDPAGSDAVRRATLAAQAQGGFLRLALQSRDARGELALAGADAAGCEPTLFLGPTCELNLQGEGRVRVNGVAYDLPFCADLAAGQTVNIQALCPDGYGFSGWSGDLTERNPSLSMQLIAPVCLTANFAPLPYCEPVAALAFCVPLADDWYRTCDRWDDSRCWDGGSYAPRGGFWPPESHRHHESGGDPPGGGNHQGHQSSGSHHASTGNTASQSRGYATSAGSGQSGHHHYATAESYSASQSRSSGASRSTSHHSSSSHASSSHSSSSDRHHNN